MINNIINGYIMEKEYNLLKKLKII